MKLDPVRVSPKRLIKVGKRNFFVIAVDPGSQQRKIGKESEEKTKRNKKYPKSGNQQKVFYRRIGLSNKILHKVAKIG